MSAAPTRPPRSLVEAAIEDSSTAYRAFAGRGPVVWDPGSESWYVHDPDLIKALARGTALRARGVPAGVSQLTAADRGVIEPVERFFARWLAFSDPPRQQRLRRLIAPALAPARVEAHLRRLPSRARQLVRDLPPERCDLLDRVVVPLSRHTTAALIGGPPGALAELEVISAGLIAYLATPGMDRTAAEVAADAIDRLVAVLDRVVDYRSPVSTVLRELIADGHGDTLDAAALVAQLLTGALEPLTTALAVCLLAAGDEHRRGGRLATGPELGPWIERQLAAQPPFHFAPRVAATDIRLGGVVVAAGQRVVLNLLAANMAMSDPAVRRRDHDAGRHLSFGNGVHACLGSAIARTHLRLCLPDLADPELLGRLDPDRVVRRAVFGMTSFGRIPLSGRPW